ncbi:MAG: tripartite tricarboxylate transporter substrate-binding protein, partial [Hyphomicrobiales bacterium]
MRPLLELCIFAAFIPSAIAQDIYPSCPITIVVPFPAGSSTDLVARTIGQKLSERLGQPVTVDNKAGAGGNIGSLAVAQAAPDGYTLLMATVANPISAVSYAKLGYDFERDLAPVTLVATAPLVLVARADSPFKTVQDLIQQARQKPGSISYGSGGNG